MMNIQETSIQGLVEITPQKHEDTRGYFFESFRADVFVKHGLPGHFLQENQSKSEYGVIRGLHYQVGEYAQGKLIRTIHGSIWDVTVDIRPGSVTFGHVYGVELSADNAKQLWVPRGFAHGFAVLSKTAIIQYKCDAYYAPAAEAGILWNDPDLDIDWRIAAGDEKLSDKDQYHPSFQDHKPIRIV